MKDLYGYIARDIACVLVPTDEDMLAYRIDDPANNMRELCRMDTIACCDYILVWGDSVILIEDTHLQGKVNELAEGLRGLGQKKEDEYTLKFLQTENTLKFYGTMLMLCHLSAQFLSVREALDGKTYKFWVVATSKKGKSSHYGLGHSKGPDWITKLDGSMKGVKGGFPKIVSQIQVLSLADLEEAFYPSETDPPLSLPDFGKDATI